MSILAGFLAAVVIASPFGAVEGSAISLDEGVTVEISVEVSGALTAVLARPFSSFEELPPTALRDRGDGTWGGLVVFPTAANWSLVFDAIEPDGTSKRSDTVTLIEIGVDPVVVLGEPDAVVPGKGVDSSTWWLIGAIVLQLGALAALGWWTFAGSEKSDDPDEAEDSQDSGAAAGAGAESGGA